MIVNFAERAHNHNWELDPVTRSLLDTDFYKLLMLQFVWKHFRNSRFVLAHQSLVCDRRRSCFSAGSRSRWSTSETPLSKI